MAPRGIRSRLPQLLTIEAGRLCASSASPHHRPQSPVLSPSERTPRHYSLYRGSAISTPPRRSLPTAPPVPLLRRCAVTRVTEYPHERSVVDGMGSTGRAPP